MKSTRFFVAVIFALCTFGVSAQTVVVVEPAMRPRCVVDGGVATLTFPAPPAFVSVWGVHPKPEIFYPEKGATGYIVKFKLNESHRFNYLTAEGHWIFVENGSSQKWSEGIWTEPTQHFGGRSRGGGASLVCR